MKDIIKIATGIVLGFIIIALMLHVYQMQIQHQAEVERIRLEEIKCSDGSPLTAEDVSRCALIYNRNSERELDARQRAVSH